MFWPVRACDGLIFCAKHANDEVGGCERRRRIRIQKLSQSIQDFNCKVEFKTHPNIRFLGAIYNLEHLDNLRYFSNLYFHGHSVGGTNPSLLEAMASSALIIAHKNEFNQAILNENAYYFFNTEEVQKLLLKIKKNDNLQLIQNNVNAIANEYNWNIINDKYLQLFKACMAKNN